MEKEELNLEEVQEESFKVLLKLKEIFDNNGWNFYLAFGTLIGAIRHNGFIPWDDDIDIWVLREDYEKFIKYCIEHEKELLPFKLMHYSTNSKYIYPIARFCDTRYKIDYKDSKDYGLGLFIDIYPLDNFNPNDKKLFKKINNKNRTVVNAGYGRFVRNKSLIKTIVKIPFYFLYYKWINLPKLLKKIDLLSQKYNNIESEYCACLCWDAKKYIFKKEYFNNNCYQIFNGTKFKIPNGYDEILKMIYGDYMQLPPENERIAHHFYSAYKKD